MNVSHQLKRVHYTAVHVSLWLLLVGLIAVGGIATATITAAAATSYTHAIGHPVLANTCAGSQVPC